MTEEDVRGATLFLSVDLVFRNEQAFSRLSLEMISLL